MTTKKYLFASKNRYAFHGVEQDKASSLVAVRGNWVLREHRGSWGNSITICEGERICYVGDVMNDKISYARILDNCPR